MKKLMIAINLKNPVFRPENVSESETNTNKYLGIFTERGIKINFADGVTLDWEVS